ncbi:16S rRNA (guanine(527)-N(7))-methyltransferase RsmG [Chloroflexota bacterium]
MDLLKQGAKEMGIDISQKQLDLFEAYYRELIAWNKKTNLTTITDYREVQIRHFLDSLTLIPYLNDSERTRIIDIGSGGGFPGIPLNIIITGTEITLIESTGKKTAFLKHLISVLELNTVEVIQGRAEDIASQSKYREQYDISITRAVGALSTVLELTLPFCKIGGLSISFKKLEIDDELKHAKDISATLGGQFDKIEEINSDVFPDSRQLVFFRKISPTPEKYPRKPGLPSKRPL